MIGRGMPSRRSGTLSGPTSGERRLSGFFPWQTASAEIVVSDRLWPDFTAADFTDALRTYTRRRSEATE